MSRVNAGLSVRKKVHLLHELGDIAERHLRQGMTVVLAHGTFDLLHMGHIRHLEQARSMGDVLFVTVTADQFVNKGPGRPVFAGPLRAEMLATCEYVDYVAINETPTAEAPINTIKPNWFVKGPDYANPDDDVTGKIIDEQLAVEAHGGRIAFTDDITFSSSALLNRHFDIHDPELAAYLEGLRVKGIDTDIMEALDRIRDYKVLLVGDTIIDEYIYGMPLGKSPKENLVPVLRRNSEAFCGGVVAAANHIADFCREVEVLTCLGDDGQSEFVNSFVKPNVKITSVVRPGAPTTRKSRYIDETYLRKLFEVYQMDDAPLADDLQEQFDRLIRNKASDFDLVIATDFGHGLIAESSIAALTQSAKFLAVNAQSNSANHGFNLVTKYPCADYVCIDAPEARLAVHDRRAPIKTVVESLLPARIDCKNLIVTHGRFGCFAHGEDGTTRHVPAFVSKAIDTMGAGDAFLSITAPLVRAGCSMDVVAFIGNAVGAMKVGIVGHRQSVEKIPLIKYISTLLK